MFRFGLILALCNILIVCVVVKTEARSSSSCVDKSENCNYYKSRNFCRSSRYARLMRRFCPQTCRHCGGGGTTLKNIALKQPAFQFDTSGGGVAGRATDGNANTHYDGNSCTHTDNNIANTDMNWWAVDLEARYTIFRVEVVNRADCCWNRLMRHFGIHVTDIRPKAGCHLEGLQLCAWHNGPVGRGATTTITCGKGVSGRYVAVQQARKQYLTLCEVRVFGEKAQGRPNPETNIALEKQAVQISTGWGGGAGKATDGDDDGNYWSAKTCSHTLNTGHSMNSWWAVDLETRYIIERVEVVNRGDCCWGRLKDFSILVTDTGPRAMQLLRNVRLCAHYAGGVGRAATKSITCRKGVAGRYVAVQMARKGYLTLCEVKVYGKRVF